MYMRVWCQFLSVILINFSIIIIIMVYIFIRLQRDMITGVTHMSEQPPQTPPLFFGICMTEVFLKH